MSLQQLIRREILSRREFITGTVLRSPSLRPYDETGSASHVWTVDVEVGGQRPLFDVPAKAGSDGSRRYAQRGSTVLLRRNAQGRFEVVGPGDRAAAFIEVKEYDIGDPTPTATDTLGFSSRREPFEFYKGPTPGVPGTSFWNDGDNPFPKLTIIDPNGNPVA